MYGRGLKLRVALWLGASLCSINMLADEVPIQLHTLRGHERWVLSVAISPDSHWLVSGGFDATIRIWPLQAMEQALTTLRRQRAEQLSQVPVDSTTRPISVEPID